MTSSEAERERAEAAMLPQDDILAILLGQHARIRDLFAHVKAAEGEHKRQAFDELRALLAVHETGEQMVLRPVTRKVAGPEVADARNHEESEANRVLAELEKMDIDADSVAFVARLTEFERSVVAHAEREESEEFPAVRAQRDAEQRQRMGKRLRAAEKIAPTHPHPAMAGSTAAQWTVGPFASIVDRVKDAVNAASATK
jgi:hypothetical protein